MGFFDSAKDFITSEKTQAFISSAKEHIEEKAAEQDRMITRRMKETMKKVNEAEARGSSAFKDPEKLEKIEHFKEEAHKRGIY